MKLTKSAVKALENAITEITILNIEESREDITSQTSVLFDTPICTEHNNVIRLSMISWLQLGSVSVTLKDIAPIFNKNQSELINICLLELISIFKALLSAKDKTLSIPLFNVINFINNRSDLDILFNTQQAKEAVKKLYPSVKCRLFIKISDIFERFFISSGSSIGMLDDSSTEHALASEIDALAYFLDSSKSRRTQLKQAFERDLSLHEKSSLLKGIVFKSQADLENIFKVYNSALRSKRSEVELSVQFLSLWMGLLDNMVIISSSLRNTSSPIDFIIEPVTENVSYTRTSDHGISESQIQYSLTIRHRIATTELHSLASGARAVPTVKTVICLSESLNPLLAMAFDAHAQKIKDDLKNGHIHKDRRNLKYIALSKILEASRKGELTPEKFHEACTDKPVLFSSCGTSKTQTLFTNAKNHQKEEMWSKTEAMDRSNTDLPTGFFIRNNELSKRLDEKYKSLLDPSESSSSPEYPDDQDKAVRTMMDDNQQKMFDKKKSLAWVSKANKEGNLHPSQFRMIEESFPRRNECFWAWGSAVEKIINEVKQDLCESLWIFSGGEGSAAKIAIQKNFEAKRAALVLASPGNKK